MRLNAASNRRRCEMWPEPSPPAAPDLGRWLAVGDMLAALRSEVGEDAVQRLLEVLGPRRAAELVIELLDEGYELDESR